MNLAVSKPPAQTSEAYLNFRKALSVSNCQNCRLSAGRTTIVVDRGNPAADTVLIGEAPGRNEDLEGRPFVGRAGRLLDELMREAGFVTEQDALVVNIVKCRPPNNRPPTAEEAHACAPYLRQQLEQVGPRWIILLGATAARHFFPDFAGTSLGERVGTFSVSPVYPSAQTGIFYHPAYILRDPRKKTVMQAHIRFFMGLRKQRGQP